MKTFVKVLLILVAAVLVFKLLPIVFVVGAGLLAAVVIAGLVGSARRGSCFAWPWACSRRSGCYG